MPKINENPLISELRIETLENDHPSATNLTFSVLDRTSFSRELLECLRSVFTLTVYGERFTKIGFVVYRPNRLESGTEDKIVDAEQVRLSLTGGPPPAGLDFEDMIALIGARNAERCGQEAFSIELHCKVSDTAAPRSPSGATSV